MARKKDMDFPPLEDLGEDFGPDFFGLGQMVDPEMLRTAGVSLLASAGSQLLGANVLERIDWFADKPKAKAGTAVLAGLVLGRLLWNTSPDRAAAIGALAGLGGMGVSRLIGDVAEIPHSLGAAEVTRTPMYEFFSPTRGDVRGMPPRQLAQPIVEGDDPFAVNGLGEDEVTADSLGSWIGG